MSDDLIRDTMIEFEDSLWLMSGEIIKLRADLAAAQQRIAALEEALSVRVAIDDTNRTLAEDWKQMCRAARAAEKRGLGLDWWDDNGKRFGLLEANIMDRLTRLPEQTEDNNG